MVIYLRSVRFGQKAVPESLSKKTRYGTKWSQGTRSLHPLSGNAVGAMARRLATEYVDPVGIEALLANRGIAIAKNPGLRPVGVGEIVRRIIGKESWCRVCDPCDAWIFRQ